MQLLCGGGLSSETAPGAAKKMHRDDETTCSYTSRHLQQEQGAACAVQVLLQRRGLRLNPVTTLYYVAPCCLGFLTLPWAALEAPRLLAAGEPLRLDAALFLASAVAAFALNLSVRGATLKSAHNDIHSTKIIKRQYGLQLYHSRLYWANFCSTSALNIWRSDGTDAVGSLSC